MASKQTVHPVGLYPEDWERIERIKAAKPDLVKLAEVVRFALQELDARLAGGGKKSGKAAPSGG